MIKVLIVDDHGLIRVAIRRLLDDAAGIEVVGEAESGEEAITIARDKRPHVVLMDIKMPGIGGLEATRKLLRFDPDMKILVITSCDEEPFPSRLLQAGAMGYLTKGCAPDEMEQAIRSVYKDQRHISPEIAQSLALRHLTDDDESPFESLSERELQVMIMITSGQKVTDIAEKLNLSPKTVNSYRYRIFEKLGVDSDVELTHMAIRHSMIQPDSILANLDKEKKAKSNANDDIDDKEEKVKSKANGGIDIPPAA